MTSASVSVPATVPFRKPVGSFWTHKGVDSTGETGNGAAAESPSQSTMFAAFCGYPSLMCACLPR